VSRLWVILRLHYIPRIARVRLQVVIALSILCNSPRSDIA
jgi:hypothetical protein